MQPKNTCAVVPCQHASVASSSDHEPLSRFEFSVGYGHRPARRMRMAMRLYILMRALHVEPVCIVCAVHVARHGVRIGVLDRDSCKTILTDVFDRILDAMLRMLMGMTRMHDTNGHDTAPSEYPYTTPRRTVWRNPLHSPYVRHSPCSTLYVFHTHPFPPDAAGGFFCNRFRPNRSSLST